jgi:hypothetical protein
MKSKDSIASLSAPLLETAVSNQRQPKQHLRYEPTAVYYLAEQAKAAGVDLEQAEGPWHVAAIPLDRPGRNSLETIPIVTNEHIQVMVDTLEHACDVAGLLNWCGVVDLNPVLELGGEKPISGEQ